MSDTQCSQCQHFTDEGEFDEPAMGLCRRYPPQVVADEEGWASVTPLVHQDARCGEFARRVM